jgi:hypothetical protein
VTSTAEPLRARHQAKEAAETIRLIPAARRAAGNPDRAAGHGRPPPVSGTTGPCGPGRCWSWPCPRRSRSGPGGSAPASSPASARSIPCRDYGTPCTWTPRSPCPSASRPMPPTPCAPGSPPAPRFRPDATVRPLLRHRLPGPGHGRASRLPPPRPGPRPPRPGRHHHRGVLPARPGPGHGRRPRPPAPHRHPRPQPATP